MINYYKKYGFITEMISENNPRLFFRRVTSLVITFYMSYLFFHFVVLNAFTINNTLVIVVSIWAGHIFLNISTLGILKNMTFGDLFVKIEYQGFRRNINQIYQIAMRSIITTTLFYIVVFCNHLAGWSLFVMIASLILAIVLNYYNIKINHINLSVIDWVTGSLALKKK
ncbi:hypothetical protein OAR38_00450 [Flavobacteriaceae bacterium]|nr:hypothetical protein [Flavobacteriaceae bacterium]MDB4087455.1 hypothetical protein [Flavobacteriaceae bacterium]MDB9787561.1 hypothetical protein [Flavobacteriaceae bacterium]MDB9902085.1 hypothetical protein [Flavobacteriaceae bacterium]MDC0958014.1 hypothetical protein [Flavobacteriaceae bacterium]